MCIYLGIEYLYRNKQKRNNGCLWGGVRLGKEIYFISFKFSNCYMHPSHSYALAYLALPLLRLQLEAWRRQERLSPVRGLETEWWATSRLQSDRSWACQSHRKILDKWLKELNVVSKDAAAGSGMGVVSPAAAVYKEHRLHFWRPPLIWVQLETLTVSGTGSVSSAGRLCAVPGALTLLTAEGETVPGVSVRCSVEATVSSLTVTYRHRNVSGRPDSDSCYWGQPWDWHWRSIPFYCFKMCNPSVMLLLFPLSSNLLTH